MRPDVVAAVDGKLARLLNVAVCVVDEGFVAVVTGGVGASRPGEVGAWIRMPCNENCAPEEILKASAVGDAFGASLPASTLRLSTVYSLAVDGSPRAGNKPK